jgi:hypothetical protein
MKPFIPYKLILRYKILIVVLLNVRLLESFTASLDKAIQEERSI